MNAVHKSILTWETVTPDAKDMTYRRRMDIVVQIESASASGNSYDEDSGIIQTKIMYDTPIASVQL